MYCNLNTVAQNHNLYFFKDIVKILSEKIYTMIHQENTKKSTIELHKLGQQHLL